MKNLWLTLALFVGSGSILFGNGGAWQTGIPATGNASASKNDRHTDVTIKPRGFGISSSSGQIFARSPSQFRVRT
jgi:hypothetical protein